MCPNTSDATVAEYSKMIGITKENENSKIETEGIMLCKTFSESKQLEVIKEEKSERSFAFKEKIETITANSPVMSDYNNNESNYAKTLCLSRYSRLTEGNQSKIAEKLNNIGKFNSPICLDKNLCLSKQSSLEHISSKKDGLDLGYSVHLNKSFYLIRNMRFEQKLKQNKRVSLDSLGGRSCCKKLKDNYEIEIMKSEEVITEREGRAERSARSARRAFSQEIKINVRERQRKYSQTLQVE